MSLLTNFQDLANTVKLALDRKADKASLSAVATSNDYADLDNKPTIVSPVQPDWNEGNSTALDFIKNKPTIPVQGTITSGSTGYATGGDVYNAIQGGGVPSGTNAGDILVWDGDEWVSKPKWQMAYIPVEYIEATGTQYIDTGVTLTGDLIVELDIEFTSIPSSSNAYLMGVRDWNSNQKRTTALGLPSTPAAFGCNCTYPEANSWAGAGYRDTNRHLWHIESGDQKIDGTTFGTGDYSNAPESTIDFSLFARHDNATGEEHNGYCKAKCYGAKYWKGNTLVRDMRPVVNIFSGEGGMIDYLNGQFYRNLGSGSFIVGPAI